MKRFKVLFGQPRMQVLLTLAVLLLAVSVVIGSGANFTSASANPSNVFTAGNLAHTNSKAGSAILTASLMKPGDTATGTVTITNSGNIAGQFSLATSSLSDTPGANGGKLSDVLQLKITDGTNTIYSGPIKSVGTVQLPNTFSPSVYSWPAAAAHTYNFTVTFPDAGTPGSANTGDNAYKGSSMTIQFDWTAVS
jgi:spore coat-associated protein N